MSADPQAASDSDVSVQGLEWEIREQALLSDAPVLLLMIALGLIGVFLFNVLASLLPLQLLDPSWQLRQVYMLIGSSPFPLITMVLLLLGSVLEISSSRVTRWFRRCRNWARFACIGYLLLLPLQVHAVVQIGTTLTRQDRGGIEALARTRQAISLSHDVRSLNQALLQLPGNPQLPPDFKDSHEPLKADSLRMLTVRIGDLEKEFQLKQRQRRLDELSNGLRAGATTLMLAVVFGAMAMADPIKGSWLMQLHRGRSHRQELRRQKRLEALQQEEQQMALRELEELDLQLRREELEAREGNRPDAGASALLQDDIAVWPQAGPRSRPDAMAAYCEELAREEAILSGVPIEAEPEGPALPEPQPARDRLRGLLGMRRDRSRGPEPFLEQLAQEAAESEARLLGGSGDSG